MIDVFVYRFLFSLLESIIFQRCIYCMIKNLNLREKRSGISFGMVESFRTKVWSFSKIIARNIKH